jgi:exosortase E/protease (VPEID-CTERM system)
MPGEWRHAMIEHPVNQMNLREIRLTLPVRIGLLAALVLLEKFALGTLVDSERARAASGVGAWVHSAQHWGFRFLVTFLAVASVLAFVGAQPSNMPRDAAAMAPKMRFRWLLVHALLVGVLAPISYFLYRVEPNTGSFAAIAVLWIAMGAAAIMAAVLALAPWPKWLQGIRSLGSGWLYAAAAALVATSVWQQSEKLWQSAAALTFQLVKLVLTPVLPSLSADAASHVIGTDRFAVEITELCSGLEGLGLMLAFSVVWLIYFRREYNFPRALLVIPVSLAAIFGLNVVRIATLLLIGNAGFPDVALSGFHSQAGWIAFNVVACALVYFSRRSTWLTRTAFVAEGIETYNPTAAYLMPLLAILGAGVVSHAISGSFELFYPLRFIAALIALYCYRQTIRQFDWRCSWRGPVVGALVFLLWLFAAHFLSTDSAMPRQLQSLGPFGSTAWITIRALASVTTVPIAEEIAYRGYLMRRLSNADFETVAYRAVRWPALLLSALVFGLAHGAFWLPGIVAGIAYGLLLQRSGQMGEAVIAHAISNALLVICVLGAGMWQLW